jgi:hypothetical protein
VPRYVVAGVRRTTWDNDCRNVPDVAAK